jgi:hypothetical protein
MGDISKQQDNGEDSTDVGLTNTSRALKGCPGIVSKRMT